MNEVNRVAVVMDGSRRHYDVAEALDAKGCLERMFADWYAPPRSLAQGLSRIIRLAKPAIGQRMSERYSSHVAANRVRSNCLLALQLQFSRRKFSVAEEFWQWSSKKTANWVTREGFGNANGIYGYIRNIHPDLCKLARQRQLRVVGEQMIAPAAVEQCEYETQQAKWPGWETPSAVGAYELVQRTEEETWASVDRIVAPSQYVIDGLRSQGVDRSRIDLIPYPADFCSLSFVDRSERKKQLTVGFVGHVNLRKNAPVFLNLAKRMSSTDIRFVMVGKSSLNPTMFSAFQYCVELTGAIPRSLVAEKLASFDVFLFPSTCEGSAGVVLEAMATGLPVVTTPNSGTSVTEGVDGFICAPDDIDGFVNRIEQLTERSLRLELGRSAAAKVAELTLDAYGNSLVRTFNNCYPVNSSIAS